MLEVPSGESANVDSNQFFNEYKNCAHSHIQKIIIIFLILFDQTAASTMAHWHDLRAILFICDR